MHDRLAIRGFVICFGFAAVSAFVCFCLGQSVFAQNTVVLRDLTVVRGEVASLDKKGLRFSDGRELDWDQVLKTNLPAVQQQAIEEFIESVGLRLFRARQRLASQDGYSLYEVAEPLFQRLEAEPDSFSDRAQYIISLATMRGRLSTQRRSAAVMPFLRACEVRKRSNVRPAELSGLDLTDTEISATLTTEILPVWFDEQALPAAIDQLQTALKPDLHDNPTGNIYYLASMLLHRQDVERARTLVEEIDRRNLKDGWQQLLDAQFLIASGRNFEGVARLQKEMESFSDDLRAAANYVVGVEQGKDKNDADLAVLNLLRIPALHSTKLNALSAAAIYEAINILHKNGQTGEALTLRKELLDRYANTYHGRLIKIEKSK